VADLADCRHEALSPREYRGGFLAGRMMACRLSLTT